MDIEQKAEVSRKLKDLSELQGLRKDVQRIMMALKKLAGIEGQNSDNKQYSWPESEGEKTEVQESTQKGKQREQKSDGGEEKREVDRQKEENKIESMKEGSSGFSPVTYSIGTGIFQFFLFFILINFIFCFSVGRKWI